MPGIAAGMLSRALPALVWLGSAVCWADLPRYNLNEIKQNIALGTFDGQKLYYSFITRLAGSGRTESLVMVRTGNAPVDLEFSTETTDGRIRAIVVDPQASGPAIEVPTILQFLYEGLCAPSSERQLRRRKRGFVVQADWQCGKFGEPEIQTDHWQWTGARFARVSSSVRHPHSDRLRKYRDLLRQGNLAEAIAQAPLASSDGGHTTVDLYQDYVVAAHRKAKQWHKRGKHFLAAAIAVWTVSRPPVDTFHLHTADDDVFVLKWSAASAGTGGTQVNRRSPEVVLKKTRRNAAIINDLAFFMRRADPKAAWELLEQVIASYPDRTAAYLNLADILYATSGAGAAVSKHYRVYLKQMREKSLGQKVPARVLERIGGPREPAKE